VSINAEKIPKRPELLKQFWQKAASIFLP